MDTDILLIELDVNDNIHITRNSVLVCSVINRNKSLIVSINLFNLVGRNNFILQDSDIGAVHAG